MKRTIVAAGVFSLLASTAMAQTVAVSMARFDDNFLTVIRNGMEEYAGTLARCPKCKMGISIPKLDDLDFVDEMPAPQSGAKRRPIPTRAAPVEDELECDP